MKNRFRQAILFLIGSVGALRPAYAEFTAPYSIRSLKAQGDGIVLELAGFVNDNPSIVCVRDTFFLPVTDADYKMKAAFLLTAQVSDRTVIVSYYGCYGSGADYIELGSVQVRD